MDKIPTIKVFHKIAKIEMIINESDFDETIHENKEKKSAPKQQKQLKLVEKDGKFYIVNKKGESVDEVAYETEADAKLSLGLMQGE